MNPSSDIRRALLNPNYDVQPTVLEEQRTPLSFAKPYGSRISEYEQVLLYNQPNPDWIPGGIGVGGWSTSFPGGRGTWENYLTEARSTDWFVFRDPEARWQRPYVSEKADEWRAFQRMVWTSARRQTHRNFDPEWISSIICGHLGALALHDYGIFMALAAPIRDALVDTLRVAVVTSAVDFLDNAQMIQAEKVYLSQVCEPASAEVGPSKALWHEAPVWQGARAYVEEAWGETYDHIEILFAIHVIHEPLFGRFARDAFFSQLAPMHGDVFTPQLQEYSARSAEAAQLWTTELFAKTLLADPKFGTYNKKLMQYWAQKWVPLEIAALKNFKAIWQGTKMLRRSAQSIKTADAALGEIVSSWNRKYAPLFDTPFDIQSLFDASPAQVSAEVAA